MSSWQKQRCAHFGFDLRCDSLWRKGGGLGVLASQSTGLSSHQHWLPFSLLHSLIVGRALGIWSSCLAPALIIISLNELPAALLPRCHVAVSRRSMAGCRGGRASRDPAPTQVHCLLQGGRHWNVSNSKGTCR